MNYEILKNQHITIAHPKTGKHIKLFKIIALTDFEVVAMDTKYYVSAGTIGGWVQSEKNLEDGSWIAHGAYVFDHAVVRGNSVVRDNSIVYDHAIIKDSLIADYSFVYGDCEVNQTHLTGNSVVKDAAVVVSCTMKNSSVISGTSVVTDTHLSGGSRIHNSTVDKSIFEDVSEASDHAIVSNCRFSGRTVVRRGTYTNESRKEEIELTVTTNNNN